MPTQDIANAPFLTIVIPTHNREEKLNDLLSSIAKSPPSCLYEIVVVDDSSPQSRIKPRVAEELGSILKLISIPTRVFISKAKNIGWKRSSGKVIFFVDDDNLIPQGTLETLLKKLKDKPQIGALMPIVYYSERPNLVWVYAAPFKQGRWSFDLVGRNQVEESKPVTELIQTDALPNAFMIRREVLEIVGGFDESLPVNSSCDLCQKIRKAGFGTFALTTAAVFHRVSPPGTPGYWAEHASEDVERRYFEVRDWFDLMARLHEHERLVVINEFVRSMQFIVAVGLGVLMHPTRRKQRILSIYSSMLRGLRDGVKIAATQDSSF